MTQHLHLDLVGGLSGDMFISGMLDAFPGWQGDLQQIIVDAGFPDMVELSTQPHDDGRLTGTRFTVKANAAEGHDHRHYRKIRERLLASRLADEVKQAALGIFAPMAEVEAVIHGRSVDEVVFHEVGAWDSIADVVLAAALIIKAGAESWSISAIPVGSGFVDTAHGRLPVPAPATARLLEGFEVVDDGIAGERVTPTGAAIIRYLNPGRQVPPGCRIGRPGYGFGTRQFEGLSNMVRVVPFERLDTATGFTTDQVARLAFEVDDQTPESLAAALEQLRGHEQVLDVMQQAYWGKKHRQGFSVTVLARRQAADEVTSEIFSLTTTLGVRREVLDRSTLPRQEVVVYVGERPYRVKVARRPNGYTAKVAMDDLLAAGPDRKAQELIRAEAERLALEQVQ